MSKRTRQGEWDRYRKREVVRNGLTEMKGLGNQKKEGDRGSFLSPSSKKLRDEAKAKVIEIKNSAAPLSIPERHYPKEFRIKKPEGEE